MTTLEFLTYLRSLDVKLTANGDRLTCNAPEGVLTAELRSELKARKPDLLALLNSHDVAASEPTVPPLQPAPEDAPIPLSFQQERLWSLTVHAPDDAAYNLPLAFRLRGALDTGALNASLNHIVRRHDVLRTTFAAAGGEVRPVVAPHAPVDVPVLDVSAPTPEEQAEAVAAHVRRISEEPFDGSVGPLYRIRLLRAGAEEHVLVVVMHHIISDGWSFDVFLHELSALYDAHVAGQPPPLAPLPLQYSDYAVWQRSALSGEVMTRLRQYWSEAMSGDVPPLDLPTSRVPKRPHGYDGATQSLVLSAEHTERLRSLSRREGVTLFMTLLAAYTALLYQHTGQTDLVLCSPAACRDQKTVQGVIGYFNNVLALRTDLSGTPSFRTLLQRVRRVALGAYQHQDFPFQHLASLPNLTRTPLTRGMFTLHQEPPHTLALRGLEVTPLPASSGTSNFDLALSVQAHGPRLEATFTYKTALFEARTIADLLSDFEQLLEAVVSAPEQPIAALRSGPVSVSGDGVSDAAAARIAVHDGESEAGTTDTADRAASFIQPRTALELQLAKLWEDVLRTEPVGVRDDFFDLGGHSLLAAELFERIERQLGRRLPLATIFELSTVEDLARALDDEGWTPGWSSLVPIRPGGVKPPLFCVHSWEGHVLFYRDLARNLDPDQPFYALQGIGLDGEEPMLTSVEDMAAHYLREIRSLQPQGPYYLSGRCFGATIAYEMAQQLVAAGEEIGALIPLDGGFVGNRTYLKEALCARGVVLGSPYGDDGPPLHIRWQRRLKRVWNRPRHIVDKLIRKYRWQTDPQYRRFMRVQWTHKRIADQYVPEPYPGAITMIFTKQKAATEQTDWDVLSWDLLAQGGTSLHVVPGWHHTIMNEPQVRTLAAQLQDCLDKARLNTPLQS